MSEQLPKGVSPKDFVKTISSKEGGSLTFTFGKGDVIAKTIGHIGALPTDALLLMPDSMFKSPTVELLAELAERWKDVPFKGDILVRVGHTSLLGDLQRVLASQKDVKNGLPLGIRILALPGTVLSTVNTKFTRADHYNPFTKTVNIYNADRAIGMHEIGHAKDLDSYSPWGQFGMQALRVIPGAALITEWNASKLAMQHMKTDAERKLAMKRLEPAFGTYVFGGMLQFGFGELIQLAFDKYFAEKMHVKSPIVRARILRAINTALSVGPGHILSRLPNRTSTFGWVFEGKAPQPLADDQVLYAQAKPTT